MQVLVSILVVFGLFAICLLYASEIDDSEL